MNENSEHPPSKGSGAKNQPGPNEQGKAVNTKRKVRAWIFWAAIAGLAGFFAQFIESFHNKLVIPSLILVLVCSLCSSRALWLQSVNYGSSHREATGKSSLVIIVTVILCGFLFWYRYRDSQTSSQRTQEPIITVEPGPSVPGENPFASQFILANHGPGKIYRVSYRMWWNDPTGLAKRIIFQIQVTNELPELAPLVKREFWVNDQNRLPPLANSTRMDMEVKYTTENSQVRTNFFQFRVSKINGQYEWHSFGDGEPPDKIIARVTNMPPPKFPWETNPILQINVARFTEPELAFSVQNTGGEMAKCISLEFAVVRESDGLILSLLKSTNSEVEKESLCPGAIISNRVRLPSNFAPFYNQIISNELVLAGKVHFQNNHGNEFGNTFEIINTNAQFTVERLDDDTNTFEAGSQ